MLASIEVFPGCRTAHDVAVTSFRVIDAPAAYIRRHVDESERTTTTTTTTTTIPDSDVVAPGRVISNASVDAEEGRVDRSGERIVSERRQRSSSARESGITDSRSPSSRSSRITSTRANPQGTPARTPRVSASPAAPQVPVAKPVPGKAGYVFSPFDPNGGYVDVTGYKSGDKVKDPYSKKIFLVP